MAGLFIIPVFPNPNIHYSVFIQSRYLLFIIQLPPPKLTFIVAKTKFSLHQDDSILFAFL